MKPPSSLFMFLLPGTLWFRGGSGPVGLAASVGLAALLGVGHVLSDASEEGDS